MSEPTIAFHFGSKAGLLVAVLGDYYDELLLAMEAVLDTEQEPLRRLEVFAGWWVTHNGAHIDLLSVFSRHGRGHHGELVAAFADANRRVTRAFERLVEDAKRAGLLRAGASTRIIRDAFFGGAEHLMIAPPSGRRDHDLAAAAAELLALLIAGAAPRPQGTAAAGDTLAEVDGKLDEVLHLLRAGHDV